MKSIFLQMPALFIFVHVICAIIWIGGMVAMRFVSHYSLSSIEDVPLKLGKTLDNLQRFFKLLIPFIVLLFISAFILIIGLNLNYHSNSYISHLKEAILIVMISIFILVYRKRNKAQHYYKEKDFKRTKKELLPIAKYYIPLNIILGVIQVYLGIVLRGF